VWNQGAPGGHSRGAQRLEADRVRRPLPSIGRHRYFHKLYALDRVLPDLKRPTKAKLEEAMKGHILAEAVLMGTYQRNR